MADETCTSLQSVDVQRTHEGAMLELVSLLDSRLVDAQYHNGSIANHHRTPASVVCVVLP